jgi:hypothetical protein
MKKLNKYKLPEGSFAVSIDVIGIYSNIPHKEGLECLEEALNTRQDKSVSSKLLIKMFRQVLNPNNFEFDQE